jgi:hypothetical protein
MRPLLGIAELHSIMASAMQAARRSAVASSWADAAIHLLSLCCRCGRADAVQAQVGPTPFQDLVPFAGNDF